MESNSRPPSQPGPQINGLGPAAIASTLHRPESALPMPTTISVAAQHYLAVTYGRRWIDFYHHKRKAEDSSYVRAPLSLSDFRVACGELRGIVAQQTAVTYPARVETRKYGGVEVFWVTPEDELGPRNEKRVLINATGTGTVLPVEHPFEAYPLASLLKIAVATVRYRLRPEFPLTAAIDDVTNVYRELLKSYDASAIGIYGTSSGAVLTGQVTVNINKCGLPRPGAIAMLGGAGSLVNVGDTVHTNGDLDVSKGLLDEVVLPANFNVFSDDELSDPVLVPMRSDLERFPPTLLVSGTRDHMLSGSAIFHHALCRAGASASLHVFEAMPHAHWYYVNMPETRETYELVSNFFHQALGRDERQPAATEASRC